ncbi:hypothetical protein AgCh_034246 [Apium graveolens]
MAEKAQKQLLDSSSQQGASIEIFLSARIAACVLVPGEFGDHGVKGMILAANYARENKVPYLGIFLGMQISVIDFDRSGRSAKMVDIHRVTDDMLNILYRNQLTLRGSNKVLVCHGAYRGKTLHEFSDYDFVITTYSIIEAEYRKNVMPPKQKCIWCGKSEKGKGVESVDEGKEEYSKKGKHYNKDKTFGAGSSTNMSEGAEYGSCNSKSILHSVKWDRIILDEVSREHKSKNYEVIDEARVFVGAINDATNFASADTIYGSTAYPSGENCLGNAALVS